MKKYLLLIVVFTVLNSASYCGDKSWFKSLSGQIDGSSVTMNIIKYGDEIKGYYYYNKYSVLINVLGTLKGDSLSMVAYLNSYDTEIFKGIYKGGTYSGRWELDTTKTGTFILKENKSVSDNFEYVYVYGSKKLFEKMETSPTATYTEGCIWPGDDYEYSSFLRKQILSEKAYPLSLQSIGTRMLESKSTYMKAYFEQYKNTDSAEAGDMGWNYSIEDQDILTLAYIDKKIAILSRFSYYYSGGAHGNYGTGFVCLDITDQKVIRLEDVLSKQGLSKLPALLEKNYRKQNDVDPKHSLSEAGLFVDTIRANDNFIITPGALVFSYTPYEIAPYAAGEVMIYIPIEEIKEYIKPEFKKLLM